MIGNKKATITISSLFLSLLVIDAFILHLVTYASSGFLYCALIAICTLIFGISKPIRRKTMPSYYFITWILAVIVLWVNYFVRYNTNTVLVDDVVLTFGFVLILLFSDKLRDYNSAIHAILAMSFLFAIGVYLQRYIPSVYSIIIRLFPSRLQESLMSSIGENGGVQGFATNVGFTANYILVGIFVLLSRMRINEKPNQKAIFEIIILSIALLMTGKRGPIVFSLPSVFLAGIIPMRGGKKFRKIRKSFVAVIAFIALFFMFEGILEQIPVFGRYVASINGFINGDDVSSGRSRLYAWAVQLFLRNPIFGIGWGKYRTTVVGNATLVKALDTHNVYLQLLCETGIIGFIVFTTLFILSWVMTKNAYCSCFYEKNAELYKWRPALFFSFLFQTYFLLFSLTGNPLYDQFYQVIYAFSVSITIAYRYVIAHKNPRILATDNTKW